MPASKQTNVSFQILLIAKLVCLCDSFPVKSRRAQVSIYLRFSDRFSGKLTQIVLQTSAKEISTQQTTFFLCNEIKKYFAKINLRAVHLSGLQFGEEGTTPQPLTPFLLGQSQQVLFLSFQARLFQSQLSNSQLSIRSHHTLWHTFAHGPCS